MLFLTTMDWIALGCFAAAWGSYAVTLEWIPAGRNALNHRMHRYREIWMQRMLHREQRMVDMQIMSSLQNGTAFFASTSLIAIGGALTVLRSPDELLNIAAALPLGASTTRMQWEVKVLGLALIMAYAFFKFAWAYRLFNYVALLLGSAPPAAEKDTPAAQAHARRAAGLMESAGRHFNRGQRAFFFAVGYLGWFLGPWTFLATTAAVLAVTIHRQFASEALRALVDGSRDGG